MITVSYEEGMWIEQNCECACGGQLTCCWGGAFGIEDNYILKCTRDINHNRIARRASLGPYDIPGFNLFNLKGRRKKMVEELGKERAGKLIKYEGVVSLTRVQAMEILKTIWPKAPGIEVLKAAMICHQYGLNPLMKHLFLIPFKRKEKGVVVGEDYVAVLGINSNRLIAQRRHNYSYLDLSPRRMTDQEQEKVLGEVDDSRIWAITLIKDMDTGAEAMGVGSWPKDEIPYGVDKGNTKLNMAGIRSERQALDRQYPGEMPQGIEVIDEDYVPIEGKPFIRVPKGEEKTAGFAGKDMTLGEGKVGAAVLTTAVGEGFNIDLTWLQESQKALKWTDETMLSFLAGPPYKVSGKSITEALGKLTREQAEGFVNEIDSRLEKQTKLI